MGGLLRMASSEDVVCSHKNNISKTMSFFKSFTSDAIPFNVKKKKKEPKIKKEKSDLKNSSAKETGDRGMVFNSCTGVTIGTSISFSTTTVIHNGTEKTEEPTTLPKEVEECFSRTDLATMEDFIVVSQNISKKTDGWKKLGATLGFSKEELEDYSSEEVDVLSLLDAWTKAETRSATVGTLIKSLWEVGECSAAKRLSQEVLSRR